MVLSRKQVQTLVESVEGTEICIPVLLTVTTGMCYAEVFGLE